MYAIPLATEYWYESSSTSSMTILPRHLCARVHIVMQIVCSYIVDEERQEIGIICWNVDYNTHIDYWMHYNVKQVQYSVMHL